MVTLIGDWRMLEDEKDEPEIRGADSQARKINCSELFVAVQIEGARCVGLVEVTVLPCKSRMMTLVGPGWWMMMMMRDLQVGDVESEANAKSCLYKDLQLGPSWVLVLLNAHEIPVEEKRVAWDMVLRVLDDDPAKWHKISSFSPQNGPPHGTTAWETHY